jgi:hypothetical protein
MKFNKNIYSFVIVLFIQLSATLLVAQEKYNLGVTQELKVTGTSTLHDWEMTSEGARGEALIELNGSQIGKIEDLKVDFPVNSLKSGNSRMDRTAYASIDADKHTHVRFVMTHVRSITANSIVAEGNLTIAGTTRPVTLQTSYQVKDGAVQFSGSEKITFSQFDVDAPTALLGTVKTGDELEISFKATFSPSSTIK